MSRCQINKTVKCLYISISLSIVALICSLLTCNSSYTGYTELFVDRCSTAIQLTIISLLGVNVIILITYNIWNRCCKDEEPYPRDNYIIVV
jgi:uncharacterized membrane protein